MRAVPTASYVSLNIVDGAGGSFTPSSLTTYQSSTSVLGMYLNTTGLTAYRPYFLRTNGSTGYLDASAEL